MNTARRLYAFLLSTKCFSYALLWLMVLLVAGTVAQRSMGLYEAQSIYFSAWILWVGGILPLPSGATVLTFMMVSLAIKLLKDSFKWRKIGMFLTHFSMVLLVAGGIMIEATSKEWVMRIPEGQSSHKLADITTGIMPPPLSDLPFSIKLIDFKAEYHPGTNLARRYSSDVLVEDGTSSWPVHISMNNPLRYKGYTFYQSSFEMGQGDDVTILAVVKNPGRLFPYLATGLFCLGLILQIIRRFPKLMPRPKEKK